MSEIVEIAEEMDSLVTYWRHVTYQTRQPPWILKKETNRGYVAYATQPFKQGEHICIEFPTVWIHGHHPFNAEQVTEILTKVSLLDKEDSAAFYAMENVYHNDLDESGHAIPNEVGIFMTNCFDMTDSIYGTCCAMYLALARLNHACNPNAQQTHYPDTTEEVLIATRDIEIGEEINDCYIDLRQTHLARAQELRQYYHFTCQCTACLYHCLHADDALRSEFQGFQEKIISFLENFLIKHPELAAYNYALAFSKQLNNIPLTEQWYIRYLPELYLTLYQLSLSLEKVSLAQKYLKRAYKWCLTLESERSPEAKRMKEKMKEFVKAHGAKLKITSS